MRSACLPFVLIRSVTATFLARGDTATPVKASLTAVAVNVACKIALMGSLAQVGLALATSIGAWLNLALVCGLRRGRASSRSSRRCRRAVANAGGGRNCARARALARGERRSRRCLPGRVLRDESTLAVLAVIGAVVYGGVVLALFGRQWLATFGASAGPRPPPSLPPVD